MFLFYNREKIEQKKADLITKVTVIINPCKSEAELAVIEKFIKPMAPTILSINNDTSNSLEASVTSKLTR